MESITLENYRCFREQQTARLAPLTLLVGENSTGKTSFLALIRALWDVAYGERVPNFRDDPYDLGSFEDIAHSRGSRGSRATYFKAGFTERAQRIDDQELALHYTVGFSEVDSAPYPVERSVGINGSSIQSSYHSSEDSTFRVSVNDKQWVYTSPDYYTFDENILFPLRFALSDIMDEIAKARRLDTKPDESIRLISGEQPNEDDYQEMRRFSVNLRSLSSRFFSRPPFASAPVRSRPRRTYDPIRPTRDSEGESTPSYMAEIYRRNKQQWAALKEYLEAFGSELGIFNEIDIRPFRKGAIGPFQIELRKFDRGMKGPQRNFIDVGYGVSQILPVLIDIFREDTSMLTLFQQPEIHLHPQAQAALGSLFCKVLSPNRGGARERLLIVETHSDYLIDRVRMEVRDKRTSLTPEDISILFFERTGLDVKIHSLRIDDQGNVLHAPPSYRQFFIKEIERSIGFDFDV